MKTLCITLAATLALGTLAGCVSSTEDAPVEMRTDAPAKTEAPPDAVQLPAPGTGELVPASELVASLEDTIAANGGFGLFIPGEVRNLPPDILPGLSRKSPKVEYKRKFQDSYWFGSDGLVILEVRAPSGAMELHFSLGDMDGADRFDLRPRGRQFQQKVAVYRLPDGSLACQAFWPKQRYDTMQYDLRPCEIRTQRWF